ncbi:MAG: carbohydrate-binding domain-containing protein, partial [Chitinispirillia bacterium]|nr:carbohydrate-binding domain-containing protein [Chitinispirillia bacterium]
MSKVSVFVAAAFFSAMILAGGALAQDVDAQVPVLVNVDADIRIDPPAEGGIGTVGGVTGGAEQIFNIKLAADASVSHRMRNRTNSGAWVSHNRENVTLSLNSQQYQNASISLYSLNGKRILNGKASASNGTARISRANIPAGVYLLSVKGTKGNSFTTRLTHSGSILNINAVFAADSPLLRKSAADDGYGEWTITVTAAGYNTITRPFTPIEGRNPRQDFVLTIIPEAMPGDTTIINLKGTTADFTGNNVNIIEQDPYYGTIVEITGGGTYLVQGTLNKGFVAVSKKDLNVTVILKDAHITSPNYAPLVCLKKSDVTVVLATNSTNSLADGGQDAADGKYGFGYDPDEQPNAALLIRRNLTIKGTGKLNVTAKCNNGIGSRASLKIEGGDITVSAPNNALKGNDAVTIAGGTLNLTSGEDGIKTEERDAGLGVVSVTGGSITITAGKDGVDASTGLNISNAAFKVKTGGGSGASGTVATSAKGLKADSSITIFSGTFDIDSKDDAIHA